MKESDPPLPDVLEACTVYLTRHRDGWSVTVDAVGIRARSLLTSPAYLVARRAAWAAAIQWRAYLLIEDGSGQTSCLSPEEVLQAARQEPELSGGKQPGGG
jgi:hypothetical protein